MHFGMSLMRFGIIVFIIPHNMKYTCEKQNKYNKGWEPLKPVKVISFENNVCIIDVNILGICCVIPWCREVSILQTELINQLIKYFLCLYQQACQIDQSCASDHYLCVEEFNTFFQLHNYTHIPPFLWCTPQILYLLWPHHLLPEYYMSWIRHPSGSK